MLYNLFENRDFVSVFAVALLAEGVDRNPTPTTASALLRTSPSSRRAWIEIQQTGAPSAKISVALLAEGVDRNLVDADKRRICDVALLAEGVDRNQTPQGGRYLHQVALLAEGVDRNISTVRRWWPDTRSPSSRRAWIEIRSFRALLCRMSVALLAEGVDRNQTVCRCRCLRGSSPSSRRAWIEIPEFPS